MADKSRARDFEQQLTQLRWRRMQNERAIRNSLEATKVLRQKDTILGLAVDQSSEKTLWMSSIVRDELSRPLVITDAELHQVQYEDNKVRKRLHKYSVQQLDNVNKMSAVLESRQSRTNDGARIKAEQLQQLDAVKTKLRDNLKDIDNRTPYINVKHVVAKIF